MSYAWEKFYLCVKHLVGSGPVQQRLADAFIHNLSPLKTSQVPEDLRSDFVSIRNAVTRIAPTGEEGSINATAQQLTDEEASEICRKIVDLFNEIAHLEPRYE